MYQYPLTTGDSGKPVEGVVCREKCDRYCCGIFKTQMGWLCGDKFGLRYRERTETRRSQRKDFISNIHIAYSVTNGADDS